VFSNDHGFVDNARDAGLLAQHVEIPVDLPRSVSTSWWSIEDAQDITIDFTDVPFSVTEFYELLDFPSYLAERAAGDAEANAPDPFRIDMWSLHSGATYALTHFFKGKEGNSLDGYARTANDLLFNPEGAVERVKSEYERQIKAEDGGDQEGLKGERALARIEDVSMEVQAKAEQFEEREETLRERFKQAAN